MVHVRSASTRKVQIKGAENGDVSGLLPTAKKLDWETILRDSWGRWTVGDGAILSTFLTVSYRPFPVLFCHHPFLSCDFDTKTFIFTPQ